MPASAWYDNVQVTFDFAGTPWMRTGAFTIRSRTYDNPDAHDGAPTNAGLVDTFAAMEGSAPVVHRFTTPFVLDDISGGNGRDSVGGQGEQIFSLADYFAQRSDSVAAWTTIGRDILDFAVESDLPGWTEDATLETDPTADEWATVIAVAGQAEYAHSYYVTADNTFVFGNFGFAYVSSPDVVWNEDGTIDADPAEGAIDPPFSSAPSGPIPPEEFPWNQLITSDGKTISVSGYILGYTIPGAAVREFNFASPYIAVETVTVRLQRYRWVTPGPEPEPAADVVSVTRQHPRDDQYGSMGAGRRLVPPPRRGRIVGGQT